MWVCALRVKVKKQKKNTRLLAGIDKGNECNKKNNCIIMLYIASNLWVYVLSCCNLATREILRVRSNGEKIYNSGVIFFCVVPKERESCVSAQSRTNINVLYHRTFQTCGDRELCI